MRPGADDVEKRTNEIGTVIPLLDMLPDISGRIVTADAMLTQRKLAACLHDRRRAFAGSKPCGCSWFFRPRLSDSCPCAVLRSRRTVRGPPDHAPEGAAAVPNSLLPQFPLSLQAAVKTPRQPGKCRSARKAPR